MPARSLPLQHVLCLALALWAALFPALGAFASAHVAVDALDRSLPAAHWSLDHDAHHGHDHSADARAGHGHDSWDGFVHLLAHELSCCAQSFAPSPLQAAAPALLAPAAPLPAAIARAPSPRLESLLRPPIG